MIKNHFCSGSLFQSNLSTSGAAPGPIEKRQLLPKSTPVLRPGFFIPLVWTTEYGKIVFHFIPLQSLLIIPQVILELLMSLSHGDLWL